MRSLLAKLGFGDWPAHSDRTVEHEQRLHSLQAREAVHERRIADLQRRGFEHWSTRFR